MALVEAEEDVDRNLAKLEALKPIINKRYERYVQDKGLRTAGGERSQHGRDEVPEYQRPFDATIDGTRRQLAAGENRDLAVKLARKEIKRRATVRSTTHEAASAEDDTRKLRLQHGRDEQAIAKDNPSIGDDDLDRQMQKIRLQIDRRRDTILPHDKATPSTRSEALRYPFIPEKSAYDLGTPVPLPSSAHELLSTNGAPKLPRKVELLNNDGLFNNRQGGPDPPPKSPIAGSPELVSDLRSATTTPTSELQPSTFTFKPAAYLENGQPLRTIFLPPDLRSRFLSIAATNTRHNLETCGILCGTLISNALFISKLVIPDQESTSDTCDTINESELFDYCDAEDLMVLGWIHTHPTQTCFMSSRDLHTHCGYQVMMPESIAIVCAPSRGE